jgi:UDP-GlcNAc:undecaprenyl-phosphate/decaprenyl-phosphate GlcNAc-1-phosphate transferase
MTNHIIWIAPLATVLLTFCFIFFFTFLAEKNNWLDNPDYRKKHRIPTPLIGGISIFFSLVLVCLFFNFPKKIEIIIYSSSLLVFIGFLDDIYNISAKTRITFQIISVVIMIFFSNLMINNIGPFSSYESINLGYLSIPLTIFISVGLINSFNFSDGIDGLAGGQAIVTIIILSILLKAENNLYQISFLSIFTSALIVYFLINTSILPIKKIFLGDAGSTLIGFIISFILIYYSQGPIKIITPFQAFWCVVIPVFDTIWVMISRILSKESPFKPDRKHLHYLLVDNGLSKNYSLVLILLFSFFISLFGILLIDLIGDVYSLVAYLILFLIYLYFVRNIKFIISFFNISFKK